MSCAQSDASASWSDFPARKGRGRWLVACNELDRWIERGLGHTEVYGVPVHAPDFKSS